MSMSQETECPYGDAECSEDDFESLCNECKEARHEAYVEAFRDTYD